MPAIITAKEQRLVKIFGDEYVFEIPLYQRPYAWTTEEVEDLLDDLTDAMERDSEAPYFLGSIVLIKSDSDPRSQVVDGQQRLTTLTMLFCVLRELSSGKHSEELDDFVRERGNELKGARDRFRLSLRERDKEFFESKVQNKGGLEEFLQSDPVIFSDSQKRIFDNVKCLHRELEKLNEEQRQKLANHISKNCFLVVVAGSDGDSAYRIFSVMNDRGLDLSPTDILKADIIGRMTDAQSEYADKWEDIEAGLGRDDFRDLFAHIRMINRKDKLRGTLQKEFQVHVLGNLDSDEAKKFIDNELGPYAHVYEIISRASHVSSTDAEKVNAPLRHLARLDNFDWIPPAMAYFRAKEGQIDDLVKFIRDLERLAYGLFIRRININERINRYAQVLNSIEQNGDLSDEGSLLQLSKDEVQEILRELDGDIYQQTRVRMPLLLRLDSLFADAGSSYQHPVISIEHVLPQSPFEKSEWMRWFPEEGERKEWTHRLANLVLLSRRKNSQASNYEFEQKKHEYFQRNGTTTFALTTQVVNQTEWTPDVLKCRQEQLIDALKEEWRLD